MSRYRVAYPSGRAFEVDGALEVHHGTPLVELSDGRILILDPRGVVLDADADAVVYRPVGNAALPEWARAWLADHPEWVGAR